MEGTTVLADRSPNALFVGGALLELIDDDRVGQLANTGLGWTGRAEIDFEPHTIGDLTARFVAAPPHLVQKFNGQPNLHPFRFDAVI